MISKMMEEALNKQINEELYSAYLYQAMSAWAESENYKGAAKWMATQAKEELEHAAKIYRFVLERGGKVKLMAIKEPPSEWGSLLEIFEAAYKHEQHITQCINDLYEKALAEKDYPTQVMLQWFIDEQVEEEAQTLEVVEYLRLAGESPNAVFMVDALLARRGGE